MNNSLSKPLMLAAFVAAALACTPAFAAKKSKVADDDMTGLLEMSDQLDQVDKEDFQAAIDRANDCTRARNFSCSERELTKAGKLANGAKDKKVLAAARQGVADEKARIAEEDRLREEERQLAEEQAREREWQARRKAEKMAREHERQARRDEKKREEQESAQRRSKELHAFIEKSNAEHAALVANIDRQTKANEREIDREAEQRREARRMEEARQSRERLAQADMRERAEQRRQEAERAAEQQRKEREAQQREEQRRKDEQAQRERAQEQERQRQREADRLAKEKAEKQRLEREANATPPVGGPPDKDGCWIPDRRRQLCVVVDKEEQRKSEFFVRYRNGCQWGIYLKFGNERQNGSWEEGAEHLGPGQTTSWTTAGGTGRYRFKYTGSDRSSSDWVCSSKDSSM